MSQHDCRLSGSVEVKEVATIEAIRAIMAPFLQAKNLSFTEDEDAISVELDGSSLLLQVDYSGQGSEYVDQDLNALIARLSDVVEGPNWLEVFDYDTGNIEDARVPHFLGTREERKLAQVQYALLEFGQWAEPIIGKQALKAVEDMVLAQPRQ